MRRRPRTKAIDPEEKPPVHRFSHEAMTTVFEVFMPEQDANIAQGMVQELFEAPADLPPVLAVPGGNDLLSLHQHRSDGQSSDVDSQDSHESSFFVGVVAGRGAQRVPA